METRTTYDRNPIIGMILLAGFALTIHPTIAQSANVYFDAGGSGSYLDMATRWQGDVVPVTGDRVYLEANSTSSNTVYFRYGGDGSPVTAVPSFSYFSVDNTGGGTMTLRSPGGYPNGSLIVQGNLDVGTQGSGAINQNNGTISANSEEIGRFGTGTFTQTGGTNSVTNNIHLGTYSTGVGIYSMSGGNISAASEYIGSSGTGTFTQSGGTNSVINNVILGSDSSGNGTYTMTDGTLQASDGAMNLNVGNQGSGEFTQSGGQVDLGSGSLYVGSSATGDGYYRLSGTGNLSTGDEYIGYSGTGTFNQSGGTHSVTNGVYLGKYSSGDGAYTMSGGTLQASDGAMDLIVGDQGSGEFTQSGGQVDLGGGGLYIGTSSTGDGTYDLSGTGSLSAGYEYVGYSGAGAFTQSGGTNSVTNGIYLGQYSSGDGAYTMSGGTLQASDGAMDLTVGNYGTGEFVQSGGGVNLGASHLYVGNDFTGVGSYKLSDTGSLSADREYIGNYGTGTFIQSGGINSVITSITLGDKYSGNGIYGITGGTLQASDSGMNLFVGYGGRGEFIQDGGQVDLGNGNLSLGTQYLGYGSYQLSGTGSLSADREYIGNYGIGVFTQYGGVNSVSNTLSIATEASGIGVYNLQGGILVADTIDATSTGAHFNITGGTLAVGTFNGDLVNQGGTLAPGNSPGITTVNGNYSQDINSTLLIEIGGLTPGSEYDLVNVTGIASLAGLLDVDLYDLGGGLFSPSLGDTFDILTAESISGQFDFLELAVLGDGLNWKIDYLIDAIDSTDVVRLSVVSSVPIPGAIWLFGSSIFALVFRGRKKLCVLHNSQPGITPFSERQEFYYSIAG